VNSWDELVSAALIGTERRPVPTVSVPGLPPAPDVAAPDAPEPNAPEPNVLDPDAAALLLDRAALLTVARRAGQRPGRAEPLTPAAADPRPEVSLPAVRRLACIVDEERGQRDMLPEWLTAVAARHQVAPAHLLPALLDQVRPRPELHATVAEVAGLRGRWLAALNPAWSYLLAQPDATTPVAAADPVADPAWQLGTADQRRGYLAALRAARPAAAVVLLTQAWDTATPDERHAFLEILRDGLCLADEPLLERALDDKRQEVRQSAAWLLMALRGAALGRRMAARAAGCLRIDPAESQLIVTLPADYEPGLRRDGVVRRLPNGSPAGGERAWWLEQILARTPLATWTSRFARAPGDIVTLPMGQQAPPVLRGWARAAIEQRDRDWAVALIDLAVAGKFPVPALTAELAAMLPQPERMTHAAALARAATELVALVRLLERVPGPWTGELADVVLDVIARPARLRNATLPNMGRAPLPPESVAVLVSRYAGRQLPPGLAAPGAQLDPDVLLPEAPPYLHDLATTLRFRHDMLEELDQAQGPRGRCLVARSTGLRLSPDTSRSG
jgi:Family of unknown function (DUF5691)